MTPPFDVPYPYIPLIERRLGEGLLLRFYRLNETDFTDCVGLLYAKVMQSRYAAILNPPNGFSSFCDLLLFLLMAPPPLTNRRSVDENGLDANVFGIAIVDHLPSIPDLQTYYGDLGEVKFADEDDNLRKFGAYIVLKAFKHGVADWRDSDLEFALEHHAELFDGSRKLKHATRRLFHDD